MLEVLNDLFVNEVADFYNYDYINKLDNNNYKIYLKDIKQIAISDFQSFLNQNKEEIMREISSIKQEYLYSSTMHGMSHNIKVLLFAFYLSKKMNLDNKNFRIIMDACKYHDIGRVNDLYDESHGLRSADEVAKIVDDKIYEDKNNLNMLKAVINYHSIPDRNINKVMNKYDIEDEQTFKILAYLLKDADGLDRVRLSVGSKTFSDLNPRYLRFDESLSLIQISHIINAMYAEYLKKEIRKISK